jgi:hypothetical protein
MSKAERTPSRPVGCWDVEAIVETSGGSKEAARKNPNPNADERSFASVQTHRATLDSNSCSSAKAFASLRPTPPPHIHNPGDGLNAPYDKLPNALFPTDGDFVVGPRASEFILTDRDRNSFQ